jgi:hypothetical protein
MRGNLRSRPRLIEGLKCVAASPRMKILVVSCCHKVTFFRKYYGKYYASLAGEAANVAKEY